MYNCPHPDHNRLYLVLHPNARPSLLVLSAELALQGRVYILDGGNSFNPQLVTRVIRRTTPHTGAILNRIQVARAFTCFQMAALVRQARQAHNQKPAPTLVLDLLSTFQDENVKLKERVRVLRDCLLDLQAIKRQWGVVVSARPGNTELETILIEAADRVFYDDSAQKKDNNDGTHPNINHPGIR